MLSRLVSVPLSLLRLTLLAPKQLHLLRQAMFSPPRMSRTLTDVLKQRTPPTPLFTETANLPTEFEPIILTERSIEVPWLTCLIV